MGALPESRMVLTWAPKDVAASVRPLRGVESERSFLQDAERFFSHLFPGVVGLAPSTAALDVCCVVWE